MKEEIILERMFAKLTKVPQTMKAKYEMKQRLPFKCANENKRIQRRQDNGVSMNSLRVLPMVLPSFKPEAFGSPGLALGPR